MIELLDIARIHYVLLLAEMAKMMVSSVASGERLREGN